MANANQDIRRMARGKAVPLWRIALEIGISEPTLTRWLRVELDPERRCRIIEVIEKLAEQ